MCVCTVWSGVLEEDTVSIHAGKDFTLMRTHTGKVTSLRLNLNKLIGWDKTWLLTINSKTTKIFTEKTTRWIREAVKI